MLRIFFIFIILFIGCESDIDSVSLQIQTDIDTTVARIGDILNLSIKIQNTGERIAVFPEMQVTESMEIRDKTILSKWKKPYQVDFQIVFWDTGSFTIPEYSIEILKADSTKDILIKADPIEIKIISMLTGVEDTYLRPIKDPVTISEPVNWYRWILATILLLLLLILLGLWRKRIKKVPFEKIEISDYRSSKDIAFTKIENLKKLVNADSKVFYLQVSFIMREFIENQYYVKALEMTTNEIIEYESEYSLQLDDFNTIINLLNRADLAKFAKFEFTVKDRKTDYEWILNFISNFSDKQAQ